MKNILFIVRGIKADFLCDMVYHGLTELQQLNVQLLTFDGDYRWMFINQSTPQQRWNEWGHGFTVTNIIDPIKKHRINSKDEAINKIQNKYYDSIIYGSIMRCNYLQDIIVKIYPKNKIAFINGQDWVWSDWTKDKNIRDSIILRSHLGTYFKRQQDIDISKYCKPISFAVPQCKIAQKVTQKKLHTAFIIPGKQSTYIYKQ